MANLDTVLGNQTDNLEMASMLPAVDDDTTPSKPKDEWNPLGLAQESWESATSRFRDAGYTEVDPEWPLLIQGLARANDYLADMGLAGLDLVDTAARSAIGTVSELVTRSDSSQKRLERDLMAMPEAFAGAGVAKATNAIDDAIEAGSDAISYGRTFAATNELDPNVASMFVPVFRPKNAYTGMIDANYAKQAQKAQDMKDKATGNGMRDLSEADRQQIYKETGLFQLGKSDEWLREISDTEAEIALTQQANPKTETITRTRTERVGGLSREQVVSAKTQAQLKMIEIRTKLRQGMITEQEAAEQAQSIQDTLNETIGSAGGQYETITETVEVPTAVSNPLTPGKKGATLDQVLNHPEALDLIKNKAAPGYKFPTAEAGRRKASSAGEDGYYGIHYPDSPANRKYTDKRNRSMISSFTDAGDGILKSRNARNNRDAVILDQMDKGEITQEQARADLIMSTMLHEVQHFMDAFFKSESGRGFNTNRAKEVVKDINKEYKARLSTWHNRNKQEDLYNYLNRDVFGFRPEIKHFDKDQTLRLFKGFEAYNKTLEAGADPEAALDAFRKIKNMESAVEGVTTEALVQLFEGDNPLAKQYDFYSKITDNRNNRLYKVIAGSNDPNYEIYIREMGEAKARLVQARRAMSPQERADVPPWTMLDVPENELYTALEMTGNN